MKKRFRLFLHFLLILSLPIFMGIQGFRCNETDEEEEDPAQQALIMQTLLADSFTVNGTTIREAQSSLSPFGYDPYVFAQHYTYYNTTTLAYGAQYTSGSTYPSSYSDYIFVTFDGSGDGYHTVPNGWIQIDTWGDVGTKITGSYQFSQDGSVYAGTFSATREPDDDTARDPFDIKGDTNL